jgi:polar amino acid transport system substrate-binding protein
MRRMALAAVAVVAAAGLAACGSSAAPGAAAPSSTATSGGAVSGGSSGTAASCSNAAIQQDLYTKGALTVATDKPVYPPWFENNTPTNRKGYESAVAYAIAAQLGFQRAQVHWAYEPFVASYAPGPK